jgi:hypothetical protein
MHWQTARNKNREIQFPARRGYRLPLQITQFPRTIAKYLFVAYSCDYVEEPPEERENVLLLSMLRACVFWRVEAKHLEFR